MKVRIVSWGLSNFIDSTTEKRGTGNRGIERHALSKGRFFVVLSFVE